MIKVLAIKSSIRVIAYIILSPMNMCPFLYNGVSYFGGHCGWWGSNCSVGISTSEGGQRQVTSTGVQWRVSIRKIQISRRGHPLPVWKTGSQNPVAHSPEPRNDDSTDGLCCTRFFFFFSSVSFSTLLGMLRILIKELCAWPSATCIWHLN